MKTQIKDSTKPGLVYDLVWSNYLGGVLAFIFGAPPLFLEVWIVCVCVCEALCERGGELLRRY